MRPTPQKLALLMSLAGLGLSLGQSAQAKSEPAVRPSRETPPGLKDLLSDADDPSPAGAELDLPQVPAGPLDVSLPLQGSVSALSDEDRAAVALAMVLMAEPPEAAVAMPTFAIEASRWQPSPDFKRDFSDDSAPGESSSSPGTAGTATTSSSDAQAGSLSAGRHVDAARVATTLQSPSQDLEELLTVAQLDLDIDLGGGANAVAAAHSDVDVNIDLSPVLDLNLDLGTGLDLNLDAIPEVDLRLDRPPVFAVTRLKPLGTAAHTSLPRPGAPAGRTCTAAEPIVAIAAAPPTASPTQIALPAQIASPALTTSPANPASLMQPAQPPLAPTIVVASHADRVLRSLEVLLANDETQAIHFGARSEEVFVTSHAEKALLMLASTCAGDQVAAPSADQTPRISKVEFARPTATCKPTAKMAAPARAPRRSAIGDDAVALSQGDLNKVRGGFETNTGLKISFGIERAVYINGALVTTTSLNVSDLGKVTSGAGALASAVAGSGNLTLIQNGPGNTFQTGPISAATVGTIIQNSLNDQKIQNVTAINATVNSLQIVRAQNLQSTLRGVLIDSLRR